MFIRVLTLATTLSRSLPIVDPLDSLHATRKTNKKQLDYNPFGTYIHSEPKYNDRLYINTSYNSSLYFGTEWNTVATHKKTASVIESTVFYGVSAPST